MRILLIYLFTSFLTSSLLLAQDTIDIRYFKKNLLDSEVTKIKKAQYEELTVEFPNGVVCIEFKRLKDNHLLSRKFYLDDEPVGFWESYDEDGKTLSKLDYDQQLLYTTELPDDAPYVNLYKNDLEHPVNGVFVMPELRQYQHRFVNYLYQNLRYPEEAVSYDITGTVSVLVEITTSGRCEMLAIYQGADRSLDLEAARLITEMPSWKAASIDGKPIKVYSIVDINFSLVDH